MATSRLGVVVFGASGFTGQFVVEELARTVVKHPGVTWGVAGRDKAKLTLVLEQASKETGSDLSKVPIIVADINDQESLVAMCRQAKVVANCVGPYRMFGEPVVKACLEAGTHHIDVSGEPEFLEGMQLKYDQAAQDVGVYVVSACGLDSIPAEMGVAFAKKKFDGDVNDVEAFVEIAYGPKGMGGHYGTWASAVNGIAHMEKVKEIRRKLFPTRLPRSPFPITKRSLPMFGNSDAGGPCIQFFHADKSVVMRTQRFNYEVLKQRPVQFNSYLRIPSYLFGLMMMIFGLLFFVLARWSITRKLLLKYPRFFSGGIFSFEGPTREQIKDTTLCMTFIARGHKGERIQDQNQQHSSPPDEKLVLRITGPEPGYVITSMCLVQSAMLLLEERHNIPRKGGVLTPGAAFSNTSMIERLESRGVKFEVVSSSRL